MDGDSGAILIKGSSDEACQRAADLLRSAIEDPEPGKVYRGCRVTQVMPFGAFVEVRRLGLGWLESGGCGGGLEVWMPRF